MKKQQNTSPQGKKVRLIQTFGRIQWITLFTIVIINSVYLAINEHKTLDQLKGSSLGMLVVVILFLTGYYTSFTLLPFLQKAEEREMAS